MGPAGNAEIRADGAAAAVLFHPVKADGAHNDETGDRFAPRFHQLKVKERYWKTSADRRDNSSLHDQPAWVIDQKETYGLTALQISVRNFVVFLHGRLGGWQLYSSIWRLYIAGDVAVGHVIATGDRLVELAG